MNPHPRERVDLRLYLVLDTSALKEFPLHEVLSQAALGGVTVVQLRDKFSSDREFLKAAETASAILKDFRIPLIINDRADIARMVKAQGLHVGQKDLSWREARRLLGPDICLGVSVESKSQALALENADVDYLGVSSVFPTNTKTDLQTIWGLQGLRELKSLTRKPLVGIGGIHEGNAMDVLKAGAHGLAVVSAICSSPHPRMAAQTLRKLIETHFEQTEETFP